MQDLEKRSERLELIATVLLAVATTASAWCSYQAELWSSIQLRNLAEAGALQGDSLRATEELTRATMSDVIATAAVIEAKARGDQRGARYIVDVARPVFRGPLRAWLDRAPAGAPPAGTPFDEPSYRKAMVQQPNALRRRANQRLAAATEANANGDLFVMRTVMLALSLFFLGIAGQMRGRRARRLTVALGAVVLVLSLVSVARLDRASRPRPWEAQEAPAPAVEDAGALTP